jgi:CIC family chloride channel protein
LPIIGIVLTVLVVKKVLGGRSKRDFSDFICCCKKSKYNSKKQVCPNCNQFVNCWFRRFSGFRKPIVITGAFGSNYAQKYKLSYKDRTLLIGCGVAGNCRSLCTYCGFYLLSKYCFVDVSIAAFTPIMIAAATGALVSVIALDEEIYCRSNSNKV